MIEIIKRVDNGKYSYKITTHGRFKDATISTAREVLPEPELPATPIILVFAQGGE